MIRLCKPVWLGQQVAVGFRGVPVEEWVYREAVRNSSDSADILGRYTVHLYFSTPEWHFGPSSGYRILQRVALKGRETAANGTVRLCMPTNMQTGHMYGQRWSPSLYMQLCSRSCACLPCAC